MLSERKNNEPVFSGSKWKKHWKRETDTKNAMMIFRNGLFPSLVWKGEQSNENQHFFFSQNKILNGHYGILRAKIRKDYLSIGWNTKRLFEYVKFDKKNYLKDLKWSKKLLNDMMKGVHNVEIMQPILKEIQAHGVCTVRNVKSEIENDCFQEMILQQLEFTSSPKWSPTSYEILQNHLFFKGYKRICKIPNRELVLQQISGIFHDKFAIDFLERRINALGFYFHH